MKKIFAFIVSVLISFAILSPVLAAGVLDECFGVEPGNQANNLRRAACAGGLVNAAATNITTTGNLIIIVAAGLNIILGLTGVLFVILTIYAGYLWMTARGNEEQAEKALNYIKDAIIGIIIIFSAFSISRLLVNYLSNVSTVNS